jgi:hypothetical protein
MATITLENTAAVYDQLRSTSTVSMAAAQAGGTITSPAAGSDFTIGQSFSTPDWRVEQSFDRFDISAIPENSIITDVQFEVDLDVNNVTTTLFLEAYFYDWDWTGINSSDFQTTAKLVALEADKKRIGLVTIASGTALGNLLFTEDATVDATFQEILAGGQTYVGVMYATSEMRNGTNLGTAPQWFDIEDSVAGQRPRLKITYVPYDNTDDESTTIAADSPGASDCYSRYSNATYSTAAAGAGTLVTASGITISGQSWSGSLYLLYQSLERFDISGIPSNAIITDVKFEPYWQYNTSTQIFTMEVWDWNWVSFPPTPGVWQTPGELTSLYDTGKRVAWLPESGITSINARHAMNIDGWVRRMQVAVDAAQTYFNVITATTDNRGAVVPTTSAEYAYWDNGGGGANAANLTVYYTLPGGINAGMLGAFA